MVKHFRQFGKAFRVVLLAAALVWHEPDSAVADVVVVQNLTGSQLKFTVLGDDSLDDAQLAANASLPFYNHQNPRIVIGNTRAAVGKNHEGTRLQPNAAYEISLDGGAFRVKRIPLGGNEFSLKPNPDPVGAGPEEASGRVIPVSLWVDEELPMLQREWEPKYRKRFERAATIIQNHSGVQFRVQSAGRWNSNNRIRSFSGSLFEFIDEVHPGETLAVGFSLQHARSDLKADRRIAGTRKPLDRHILVREWKGVSEEERVELLVHELGHFLGASHSNSRGSVMRPRLADGQARKAGFEIQFDATNVLLMSLIGRELNGKGMIDVSQLSRQARRRLRQIYTTMALKFPADPVPTKYLELFLR